MPPAPSAAPRVPQGAGGIVMCMNGAVSSTHWAAIATVGIMLAGAILGTLWRLGSAVKGWRDETAQAVGEVAGLVADWCDEVDDHLADQDEGIRQMGQRVGVMEEHQGLPRGGLYLPRRRRNRPRRMEVAERGLRAPERRSGPSGSVERGGRYDWGGHPPR